MVLPSASSTVTTLNLSAPRAPLRATITQCEPFLSSLHVTPTGPSNPENCRQTLGIHAPVSVRTKRRTLFLSVSHTYTTPLSVTAIPMGQARHSRASGFRRVPEAPPSTTNTDPFGTDNDVSPRPPLSVK